LKEPKRNDKELQRERIHIHELSFVAAATIEADIIAESTD